ncbi:hypothetical protein TCDM_12930 [Trypanosoma cruzi Dm28c]|uniref:Uncharacterized protein n=1 Tax=Trypanosoma cruzi Dm28c TaxID=1416333 RepID=V5AK27_TRYCR|nr:hypothetical protein TCDM_12930 [Trypanosoma cruzi Dm28c]
MPAEGFFPNKNAAAPHARKNVWSVAADTLTSWACAAPRCSALQVRSPKAPIREHSTTATAVTLPISHKGKGLQWRSGRRHAQSQSNGLPRKSRSGDAPLLWETQQKIHVSRIPREQHTLNRIQLHYCGHPHTQHECENAGQKARNNTTHPSNKGFAVSMLPSTIIPPQITPLHIRSKKAHTVYTTSGVPKAQNRIIRALPSSQC